MKQQEVSRSAVCGLGLHSNVSLGVPIVFPVDSMVAQLLETGFAVVDLSDLHRYVCLQSFSACSDQAYHLLVGQLLPSICFPNISKGIVTCNNWCRWLSPDL